MSPAPESPLPPAEPLPLLQDLMETLERETGLRISFDDLTGGDTGAHADVPAMRIDRDHQQHACRFCVFAKGVGRGPEDCVRNKLAVNRTVMRRRAGVGGLCHLGLFDLAEPLIYRGHVLGVFYGGSVLVRGREEETRARIRRYCARRGQDAQSYYDALAAVPTTDPADIPAHRRTLRLLVRMAQFFYETAGVRPEVYPLRPLRLPYRDARAMPFVVKAAMRYVRAHLHEPFGVKELAAELRCHPDFLGRRFKQHTGTDLSRYLQHARIERARRLLENPRATIDDVAARTGFADRFHFSRVFRRVTGSSPGAYRKGRLRPDVRA